MTSSLASASSWSDDISWSNEGYASQAGSLSKVGGVPVLTGTPEGLLLQAGDVGISGGGPLADQPWSVFGTSSTTVGTHRAYVEGWNRQIGVRSSWSEEVVFSGPAGTLHTNLGVFLDFSYLLPGGTGAYVEAVLTLDVYQQFTKLATFEIAVSYERPIGGEMAGQCVRHYDQNWYQPAACGASVSYGFSGDFAFLANQPVQLFSSLYVSAVGYSETERATLDARNTAGISFMDLPSGYDFAYASGREDNPLGIAPALAVPEISTAAMSVGGLLVIGSCQFRRRRQKQ